MDVSHLPAVNASLNGIAAVLLVLGYVAIKRKKEALHKALMLSAVGVSAAFLTSYLFYHFNVEMVTVYPGLGWDRYLYYLILATHIPLATIMLPFIFGIIIIVPIHIFLWQKYYNQDLSYSLNVSHLWFLGNIFIYVVLLFPLFFYIKSKENSKITLWLKKIFGTPAGYLLIIFCFVLEGILINPETYETYSMTIHGFLLGLMSFLFGFIFIISGNNFWNNTLKWRWIYLCIAVILFGIRNLFFQLKAPNLLLSIESINWILSLFGFAYKYLNHPGKALSYLRQAAYPVYILHMIFIYVGSYLVMPLQIPPLLKFVIIVVFTFIGCFAFYDLIIKRVKILRPLFGLTY